MPIEILFGDHQSKPDIAAALARAWSNNDGVEMITDMPNSAAAVAVSN